MPTIITATELRTVLGVSSALYSDAVLNSIIDTAEIVVLPLLTTFSAPISRVALTDNVATFTTTVPHEFTEGSSIVIAGCGSPFNGTRTALATITEYTFEASITNADILAKNIIPAGTATLTGASTYVGNPAIQQAIIIVSVEVFQSRTAAGGQIEGVDFTPTPYRMGRSLINRISGMIGSYIDVESVVA